jgi:predicted RNA-binding Zn-ribbon protein involved in translation (DUF1610 family)
MFRSKHPSQRRIMSLSLHSFWRGKMTMSETNRFCGSCGASLQSGSSYCPKCGASLSNRSASPSTTSKTADSSPRPMDWREQRRQWKAQRRTERYSRPGPHIGGLIIATILIVAGLGIFFPELPWQVFWGSLLILLGLWIVGLWTMGGRRSTSRQQQQMGA